ncbi:FecR family protein [Aquimarina addita]|uniref:FecR family protein n=1 Tax=Aquimarina addita TaxID=870485 RepID=A0ABP6UJ99_9FLAO
MLTKIQKYLQGEATSKEIEEIEEWIASNPEHKKTFKEQVRLSEYISQDTSPEFDTDTAFRKVEAITKAKRKEDKRAFQWFAIAACLLLVLGSSLFWKFMVIGISSDNDQPIVKNEFPSQENNEILLKLADGTIKVLKNNTADSITNSDGTVIGRQQQNIISFELQEDVINENLVYNEIIVPKGKIFTLVLSDGSKIWLNAESTFRFPQKFLTTEKVREVALTGEAYFEVTTNKKQPFIVTTAQMDITVLGTRFNVSSYQEDQDMKTTLVEGSVVVAARESRIQQKLIPGDQASLNSNTKKIIKRRVNAQDYIAWVDNRLIFDDETFTEICRKIERTYNVTIKIEYEAMAQKRFTGEFDIENIADMLTTFSISKPFDFTIQDKIITIKEKK